jgi:hypothetical protein
VVREYLVHRKALKKHHPRYKQNCPTGCLHLGYNIKRFKKCEECPLLEEEENFKRKAEGQFKAKIPRNKHRFDEVLKVFYVVMAMEDVPKEKISVKNNCFLNVYLSEQRYAEEKADFKGDESEQD